MKKIGPVTLTLEDEGKLLKDMSAAISNLGDKYEPVMLSPAEGENLPIIRGAECEIVLRAYLHGKKGDHTGRVVCLGIYPLKVEAESLR